MLTGILSWTGKIIFIILPILLIIQAGYWGNIINSILFLLANITPRQLPFINSIAGQGELARAGLFEDIYIEPFGYIRVLICYEIIFPAFIARDKRRPDLLAP